MTVNNRDNLRTQLIDAMMHRFSTSLSTRIFDQDLWPVLEAAMKSGELLVHRNTTPQEPIAASIVSWLKATVGAIALMKGQEATVSKAEAMRCLEQLAANAQLALEDAERANNPLVTVPLNGTIS